MPQNVQSRVQQQGGAVLRWFHQNRWLLMVTMFAAAVLYYPVYAYGLENLDSLCTPEPYKADLWDRIPYWETQQGRWALRLFDGLTDGVHAAVPAAFATAFFFAWAGVLLCDLLQIRHFALRTASVLLLVCSQYVQNLQSYRYCKAAYAFSFLLAVLAALFLLRGYILQSNNDIIVQKEDKLQALSIAEQIADDVLDHEEYQNGMPVVILGRPSDSTYGLPAAQNRDKANPLIQWGIFWLDTQQNMDTWARLFQENLGLTMRWCDYETAKEIHGSSAYQEMPLYPNPGSVAVLDETLVVKVS